MKTIVVGVGNPILQDDGVGIYVAKQLKKHVQDPDIVIEEAFTGGMNLLDLILGYEKAIIIDAVKSEKKQNNEVGRFTLNDFSTGIHSCNPHDISLVEAIHLAKKLGETRIPQEIVVIGILIDRISQVFGEKLSEKTASLVPKAVDMVVDEIRKGG